MGRNNRRRNKRRHERQQQQEKRAAIRKEARYAHYLTRVAGFWNGPVMTYKYSYVKKMNDAFANIPFEAFICKMDSFRSEMKRAVRIKNGVRGDPGPTPEQTDARWDALMEAHGWS